MTDPNILVAAIIFKAIERLLEAAESLDEVAQALITPEALALPTEDEGTYVEGCSINDRESCSCNEEAKMVNRFGEFEN